MQTSRNQIEAKIRPGDHDMSDQIDAVYEICDAEFPSEQSIHKQAIRYIEKYQSSEKIIPHLKTLFEPYVQSVARRDGLMSGLHPDNFKAIAERLAKDWDASYGADFRSTPKP
jgi:hypothetical protein